MRREYLSLDYIRECLIEENGRLYWKSRPASHFKSLHEFNRWNTRYAGKEAGGFTYEGRNRRNSNTLRWSVLINKKKHYRSVIVWSLHNNRWPSDLEEVDHKNRDKICDHIDNLRIVSKAQNQHNSLKSVRNKSGYKGVSWHATNKKFVSFIYINGKNELLGFFDDPEKAHEAYVEAAKKYRGEFASDGNL